MNTLLRVGPGVLLASFLAGPVFVLMFIDWPTHSASPRLSTKVLEVVFVNFLAVPLGMMFSIVPNLIGTLVLEKLGYHSRMWRAFGIWGLTGVLAGCALAQWFSGSSPRELFSFAATGAICALICRSGTRWPD